MSWNAVVAAVLGVLAAGAFAAIALGPASGSAGAAYYGYCPQGSSGSAYYQYCAPDTLVLTPPADTNPVGTSHTVTATVTAGGTPVSDIVVRFEVTGSVTRSGSCTTNASGQCTFTYTGPSTFPGADLISAYADTNENNVRDAGEPVAEATKAWVLPASTPGQVTGGGQILSSSNDKISFGFTAKSNGGLKGECVVVDRAADRMIKCKEVTALVQSGNTATIWGTGTDNGVDMSYVITVKDDGEPGTRGDTFSIETTTGYTAGGPLVGGNIQIHK